MISDCGNAEWCPFQNFRSRVMLEFLKLWGCRKKNVGEKEEEA